LFFRHANVEGAAGVALLWARKVPTCTPRASTPRTADLRVAALKPSLSLLSTDSSVSHASVKSARTHRTSSGEGLSDVVVTTTPTAL